MLEKNEFTFRKMISLTKRFEREADSRALGLRRRRINLELLVGLVLWLTAVSQSEGNSFSTRANLPPRFKSEGSDFDSQSEIVVRVKEGASSLNKEIYHLYGDDPDGDPLQFGVLGTLGRDLLRIESISSNEAKIFLKKELDREIQDSYTLVLTLTDGKLGKGNYVSFPPPLGPLNGIITNIIPPLLL